MNNDTASFGTVDGIAGFDRNPISLPSQLSKLTSSKMFSFCLLPAGVQSVPYSNLLFGASANFDGLQLLYTPILNIPDNSTAQFWYWVNMTGISINGIAVSIPRAPLEWNETTLSGGTFFDSGTSYLNLSPDIFTAVVQVPIPSHIPWQTT